MNGPQPASPARDMNTRPEKNFQRLELSKKKLPTSGTFEKNASNEPFAKLEEVATERNPPVQNSFVLEGFALSKPSCWLFGASFAKGSYKNYNLYKMNKYIINVLSGRV